MFTYVFKHVNINVYTLVYTHAYIFVYKHVFLFFYLQIYPFFNVVMVFKVFDIIPGFLRLFHGLKWVSMFLRFLI